MTGIPRSISPPPSFSKIFSFLFAIFLGILLAVSPSTAGAVPAESFGLTTRGGYGGRIIKVTNLNSSGTGSLRAALTASGARIVVFEVGGVIDLGRNNIEVRNPYLTIAGQTAPSPGITLIKGGITLKTHDVIVQHIRVRPGDAGQAEGSGWEPDGLGTDEYYGAVPYNIFFGNCSISWAVDENTSVSGPTDKGPYKTSYNITFYRCIISEALKNSSHSKGDHSMGMLVHDYARNIAVIENILASNESRNPRFKMASTGVVVNNVISNPGGRAIDLKYSSDSPSGTPEAELAIVGNVLLQGPDSPWDMEMVNGRGRIFLEDNQHEVYLFPFWPGTIASGDFSYLNAPPIWPEGLLPLPSGQVFGWLSTYAGARPADRDAIDARVIQQIRDRNGDIIDSQSQVGGYPSVAMTRRTLNPPPASDADAVEQWLRDHAAAVTPQGWERVRAREFAPVAAVDYAATDPTVDDDADGVSLEMEMLLGTDPSIAGSRELQPLDVAPAGSGAIQFSFRHDPIIAADLGRSLDPVFTTDLATDWSQNLPDGLQEIQRAIGSDGLEHVIYQADPSVLDTVYGRLDPSP